jgi:FkbM family methyltransferase
MFRSVAFSLSQRKFWKEVRRKRGEWNSVAAKNKSVIIPVSTQTKIKLDTSSELSAHIYCGAFEWEEREWLFSELKSTDVFYDIGANIGFFTLLAAEKCKAVVAFEPAADTFTLLKDNVTLNESLKNIQLINAAASDQEGTQDIYVLTNGKDAWNSMVVKPTEEEAYRVDRITTVNVDAMVGSGKIPAPHIVKIDVEGWEQHVLRGLEKTIAAHHPTMLIEFTESNLKAAGTSPAELANYIQSLNYELFCYDARYRELIRMKDFTFGHKNLIAKPKQ